MASGEAEAILVKAQATAQGIDAVAGSIRDGGNSAQGAVGLRVAEKYVEAFGRLAKEGTAVVVPGNVGDMAGMIASAMAVYGKVSEGQQRRVLEAGSSVGAAGEKRGEGDVQAFRDGVVGGVGGQAGAGAGRRGLGAEDVVERV